MKDGVFDTAFRGDQVMKDMASYTAFKSDQVMNGMSSVHADAVFQKVTI